MAEKEQSEVSEFSAIKLLKLLEARIAKIDVYPLNADNLVIQQDEYKRPGETHDYPSDAPFAVVEHLRTTKDTDLNFSFQLYEPGFVCAIDGMGIYQFDYQPLFKDEKGAADQIIGLLSMLANGQFAQLVTTFDGQPCAVETLLYEKTVTDPVVIGTEAKYPWWVSMDSEEFDFRILKNTFKVPVVTTPKDFFFVDYEPTGAIQPKGRVLRQGMLGPLTKKQYYVVIDVLATKALNGKEYQEKSIFHALYRSWEFWSAIAAFLGTVWLLNVLKILPHFVLDYPIILVPVVYIITYRIVVPWLLEKERIKKAHPRHPFVVADKFVTERMGSLLLSGLALLLGATTFMPLYVPVGEKQALSLYGVQSLASWVPLIPLLTFSAAVLALIRKEFFRMASIVSMIAAIVLMFMVNARTDEEAATPDLPTGILFGTFAVVAIVAGVYFYGYLRRALAKLHRKNGTTRKRFFTEKRLKVQSSVVMVASAAGLMYAGVLFKDGVPADALMSGFTPTTMGLASIGVGAALLLVSMYDMARTIARSFVSWIGIVTFFAAIGPVFMLKDNAPNEGPNLPYIIAFTAAFGVLFSILLRTTIPVKSETEEMKRNLFGDAEE